jgi:hypothetical protein
MGEPAAASDVSRSAPPDSAREAVVPGERTRVRVAGWAVAGVALLFVDAIYRLGLRAIETVAAGLSLRDALVLSLLSAAFVYGEGYRALQLRFAPRVIERAFAIDTRRSHHVLLAPLVVLSLVGAAPRALFRGYLALVLIASAALAVSALPSPWRGIIDGAVALALSWGLAALLLQFRSALRAPR